MRIWKDLHYEKYNIELIEASTREYSPQVKLSYCNLFYSIKLELVVNLVKEMALHFWKENIFQ